MTAISAELKTGAANDPRVGSALDPDPNGRRVKPGEGQVSLAQERPQLVDINARHREVGHDSSLCAARYSEASTAARCNDHLKPPTGFRTGRGAVFPGAYLRVHWPDFVLVVGLVAVGPPPYVGVRW